MIITHSKALLRKAYILEREAEDHLQTSEKLRRQVDVIREMLDVDISISDAVEALAELYSSDDPITYKGIECIPRDLEYGSIKDYETGVEHFIDDWGKARNLRISYYGSKKDGSVGMKNGTLRGMILDRYNLLQEKGTI